MDRGGVDRRRRAVAGDHHVHRLVLGVDDEVLAAVGITDLSPSTASGISSYVSGAPWSLDRAAGTMALVLLSPEFFVN